MGKIPPQENNNWTGYMKAVMPGFLLCLGLGSAARLFDQAAVFEHIIFLNYVLIAILLGLFVRNVIPLPELFNPGIDFSAKICLYIGIVLLGARLNLLEIFSIGASALVMVSISITACILLCGFAVKKFEGSERWGHLLGAGVGVCGISAIIALAPIIKVREREIFAAVGAVLLNDIIILTVLPAIGHQFGWGDILFGFMAGVVPSNTAQCIAIGYAYSDGAGAVATVVKSARNALLPLVVLAMAYAYTKKGLPVGEKISVKLLWTKFPKFIVGLLAAALLNTSGMLTVEAVSIAGSLSSWFFVICFAGIGAGINIKETGKQDLSVMAIGIGMAAIIGIYAFLYSSHILLLQ